MNLKLFSIYDVKSETYQTIFPQKTIGEAERAFKEHVQTEGTKANKFPEDFTLYQVGEFNETTGEIFSIAKIHVANASQYANLNKQ